MRVMLGHCRLSCSLEVTTLERHKCCTAADSMTAARLCRFNIHFLLLRVACSLALKVDMGERHCIITAVCKPVRAVLERHKTSSLLFGMNTLHVDGMRDAG